MMLRILLLLLSFEASTVAAPTVLQVDATEAPRKIYHAELNIPAAPGCDSPIFTGGKIEAKHNREKVSLRTD
jgi:hypothetical protein